MVKKGLVLIVSEDEEWLLWMGRGLMRAGYRCFVAKTEEKALEILVYFEGRVGWVVFDSKMMSVAS